MAAIDAELAQSFSQQQVVEALTILPDDLRDQVLGRLMLSGAERERSELDAKLASHGREICDHVYRRTVGYHSGDGGYVADYHSFPFLNALKEHPELRNQTYEHVSELVGLLFVFGRADYFDSFEDKKFSEETVDGVLWGFVDTQKMLERINTGLENARKLGAKSEGQGAPMRVNSLDDLIGSWILPSERREIMRPALAAAMQGFAEQGKPVVIDLTEDIDGYGQPFNLDVVRFYPELSTSGKLGTDSYVVTQDLKGYTDYLAYAEAALAWLNQNPNKDIADFPGNES